MSLLLSLFILTLSTFCFFSLGAPTSVTMFKTPPHGPMASPVKEDVKRATYVDKNNDDKNSQIRNNDYDFTLLKDDSLTSINTLTTTSIGLPITTSLDQMSSTNIKTNGPWTDVTRTFAASRVQGSTTLQDKILTVDVEKSTELPSSTFTPFSEITTSKDGKITGSSLTDYNKKFNDGTSTPMPDEQPNHTMPIPEHLQHNKSGTVKLRENCQTSQECSGEYTECRIGMCKCQLGYLPRQDDANLCGEARSQQMHPPQADPTMIGVVIGLVLMSFTLCVVMRLFSKARFQENRTIFNTPNPRLMNVSLLTGSKKLRRGSQTSINSDAAGVEGQGTAGSQPNKKTSRPRPHRQPSTDTVTTISEPGGGPGSRPISSNKQKSRQESLPSNSNV